MRAGPLSDNRIINLLNRYFVPVYTSNEDTGPRGRGAQEEIAEHVRIYQQAMHSPCGTGAVYVFILNPQGQVIDGMDVAHANQGDALARMLEKTVQNLHTAPGAALVKPVPQSRPPQHDADAVVLHLIARGSKAAFPWRVFPAENWIVLERGEWMDLLPPGHAVVGSSWALSGALARKLLGDFYPQMEILDNSADRNQIESASLKATIVSANKGALQARLDGSLLMKRTFYVHSEDNNYVKATVLGWMTLEPAQHHIVDFELVTKTATYGGDAPEPFNAALSSLP